MIVIDNNKKYELTCKVGPLVSTIKFVGTLFCISDNCTRHYDKKKCLTLFLSQKVFFLKGKSKYSFAKGKLALNFSFIQRSLKGLSDNQ